MKNKKSMDSNIISNQVLKNISMSNLKCIAIIFNHCLNTACFPNIWKTAKVIPIKKARETP